MGSEKASVGKIALYLLLLGVAIVVGVTIGFSIAYVIKDCDDDEAEPETTATESDRFMFSHAPGPCQLIKGAETGSEDIAVLPSGLAIITTGMKYFLPLDRPDLLNRTGSLKLFDFNDIESGAADIPITNEDNFNYTDFNPLGISLWVDGDTGEVVVFVINHNKVGAGIETMEKFEFSETTRELTHLETISDEAMIFMNNVIATGPNTFYYSDAGTIGYYNGTTARVLETSPSPNGINVSPDGRFVYLSEYEDKQFRTFKVEEDDSITPYMSYDLHTRPDNIDVAGGYVWIGCQVSLTKLTKYASDPTMFPAPSQVLRMKVEDGELDMTETIEVFADDGLKFSAVSVAVTYEDKMLMGSLFTNVMLCELNYVG